MRTNQVLRFWVRLANRAIVSAGVGTEPSSKSKYTGMDNFSGQLLDPLHGQGFQLIAGFAAAGGVEQVHRQAGQLGVRVHPIAGDPDLGLTMLRGWPKRALNRVLLPALGRPTSRMGVDLKSGQARRPFSSQRAKIGELGRGERL